MGRSTIPPGLFLRHPPRDDMIGPAASFLCCHFRKHVRRAFVSAQSPLAKVGSVYRRRDPSAASALTRVQAPSDGEAYRLSRIQAEGWNAAHGMAASALDKLDETQIELLNPYKSDPERMRWSTGFRSALRY